jgi:hypothetical protein
VQSEGESVELSGQMTVLTICEKTHNLKSRSRVGATSYYYYSNCAREVAVGGCGRRAFFPIDCGKEYCIETKISGVP